MPIGPDSARAPRAAEFDDIDQLLTAAFGQPDEAQLVRRLRDRGEMFQELVLSWPDQTQNNKSTIGAYAAISRMIAPKNWFCLGPVAVKPEWQDGALARDHPSRNSFRFGSRLVNMITWPFQEGMARVFWQRGGLLEGDEPPTLVVLGKPSFYTRSGFSQTRAAALTSPYPIQNTLIARPGDDHPNLHLIYPTAFNAV